MVIPWYVSRRSMEIRRITRAFFGGLLSNEERERLKNEVLSLEPELALGIGAMMPGGMEPTKGQGDRGTRGK